MINLARLKVIRGRLILAVRQHGVRAVAAVLLASVMRHGLVATARLGGAKRPFPGKRPATTAAPRGPKPDLDAAFHLDVAAWDRLAAGVGGDPPALDPRAIPPLVFVVRGEAQEPDALQKTRAAVRALGPGVRLWDEDGPAGAWWVFLEPGDEPAANFPRAFAEAARPGLAEVVSFDLWRRAGEGVQPLLAPGANPTLLEAADYLFSRLAVAETLLPPGRRPVDLEPRQLVLDWMQGRAATETRGRWRHIGRPLVMAAVNDEAIAEQRRAAFAHGRRPIGEPRSGPVSVIICTRDKGHLARQLVRRLLAEDPRLVEEVVVVSNNTANPYALAALEDLRLSPRVQVLRRDGPFNFSRLCNAGVRQARGRGPVLLLNDDITPVSEDWLSRMLARLDDPAVGSVGPLLLYPDERVQHAGIYLGFNGGAGHILRGARLPDDDYLLTGCAPREVTAVTGACLLTPREAFDALGGLDEQLAMSFQDVDYCLRLRATGLINIFEPASVLIHMESTSIRSLEDGGGIQRLRQAEKARFLERWGALVQNDPLHPKGFDLQDETLHRLARGAKPS